MSKTFLLTVAAVLAIWSNAGRSFAQSRALTMSIDDLFRTADEHNTSIKSFESAILEAEAGLASAKAERLPDVDASLAFSYLGGGRITDRNFSNGLGVHIPHYGNNLALTAQMPIYTGGAIESGISLSRLALQMAEVNAVDNRQRVRMMLVSYYLELHNLRNQERVFDENISLTSTLIDHTRKRQSEGVALRNDLTRYELQLESLKLGRTKVQNVGKTVNHQLLTALGIDGDVEILPTEAFELDKESIATSEQFWQAEATAGSPALQLSKLGIDMGEQKVRLEKSARRPSVALIAEEHLDGPITIEIPAINKNMNYFFVGVGVKYRFGSLYKNSKKVRQARQALETARRQHQSAVEGVEDAVQAACNDLLTAQAELATSRKSLELATQNYDVTSNRYDNGLALVTDMVDAANQRLDAGLRLVSSRINVLQKYYKLKFLSGTL